MSPGSKSEAESASGPAEVGQREDCISRGKQERSFSWILYMYAWRMHVLRYIYVSAGVHALVQE